MMDTFAISQVFPEDLISKLCEEIDSKGWKYGWRSNRSMGYAHWNQDYAKVIADNSIDCSNKINHPFKEAWEHIENSFLKNYRLIRCYSNSHTYGVEGYPHRDSIRKNEITLVTYLNKNWKREWGGETLVYGKGNEIAYAQIPSWNKGLIFSSDQLHCARSVTRICPEQRITLMFKASSPAAIDSNRDNIQEALQKLGTSSIKHRNGTLTSHLLRTYDKLKNLNCSQDLCNAGAIHSIFGTNAFKHVTTTDKDLVRSFAGEKAVYLAEKFSTIDRPSYIENMLKENAKDPDILDLATIEGANLDDQNSLGKWPKIHEHWTSLNSNTEKDD